MNAPEDLSPTAKTPDTSPEAHMRALREAAAIVPGPQEEVLQVTGADRQSLLQRITSGELKGIEAGEVRKNHFISAKGRLIDRVSMLAEADHLLVIASPGRVPALRAWLAKYSIIEDVDSEDVSASLGVSRLVGPRAFEVVEALTGATRPARGRALHFGPDHQRIALAIDGTRDQPEYLILAPPTSAWLAGLTAAVAAVGGVPVTALAYDAYRIERGFPLFGREVTEEEHPLEAGFWDAVSFDKGCYVGQEVLARLRNYDKIMRYLCRLTADRPLKVGATLFSDGKPVGDVRAASGPPWTDRPIALGFVKRRIVQTGAEIVAEDGETGVPVQVVDKIEITA